MKKLSQNLHHQSGVTLLLSVLILAGLTLISIAVGAFAVQQLQASRAAEITEPAIAAAETGGEESLWAIKRGATLSTCPIDQTTVLGNNSMVNSCKSFGAATFSVKAGIPMTFFLYDPNFPDGNGDTDLSGYPYSWLTITNVSGANPVNVAVERLDGSTTDLSPSSTIATAGNTGTIDITPVPTGTEGRMQVTLTSTGDNTVTANTDRGMPTFPTLDSTGCSSKAAINSCSTNSQEVYTRRINITVPQ